MIRRKKGDKMKNFTKGVNYYTRGTVALLFPEDDLCCWRCPLMGKDLAIDREICKCTGEILLSPKETLGGRCPMIFEEIVEGDFNE